MTSTPPNFIKVAGKIFFIGEYSVLVGDPALVLALPPLFSLELVGAAGNSRGMTEENWRPHVDSPAGRAAVNLPAEFSDAHWVWEDPHSGLGGFGGSTAEFAAVSYLLGDRSAEASLERYLKFAEGKRVPPSGADLATQWMGGAVRFQKGKKMESFSSQVEPLPLLIFSANHLPDRKVATHTHLEKLELPELESLRPSLENAFFALETNDYRTLGASLTHFAEQLHRLGLECAGAQEDRLAFQEIPGILGTKGCGAMLSDAVIVLYEGEAAKKEAMEIGEARGLRLLSDTLSLARGLQAESSA